MVAYLLTRSPCLTSSVSVLIGSWVVSSSWYSCVAFWVFYKTYIAKATPAVTAPLTPLGPGDCQVEYQMFLARGMSLFIHCRCTTIIFGSPCFCVGGAHHTAPPLPWHPVGTFCITDACNCLVVMLLRALFVLCAAPGVFASATPVCVLRAFMLASSSFEIAQAVCLFGRASYCAPHGFGNVVLLIARSIA